MVGGQQDCFLFSTCSLVLQKGYLWSRKYLDMFALGFLGFGGSFGMLAASLNHIGNQHNAKLKETGSGVKTREVTASMVAEYGWWPYVRKLREQGPAPEHAHNCAHCAPGGYPTVSLGGPRCVHKR